jgi:hypothetical protein
MRGSGDNGPFQGGERPPVQVRLWSRDDGATMSTLDACVKPNGDLELAGFDVGEASLQL